MLTGSWVDKNGHRVHIAQIGQSATATAEENKGPVGWKTAPGTVENHTVFMDFNSWHLTGTISPDGRRISWSNASIWTRTSPASGGEPASLTGNPKKDARLSAASVSGNWSIHQNNGFSGKLTFFQDPAGGLTGEANFGSLKGRLTGRMSGSSVEFTIRYPDGLKGHYAGTLSPNGTRIEQGSSKASNGDSATWSADRLDASGQVLSPKIKPVITGYGKR